MILDTEEQRQHLLRCINTTIPVAITGANRESLGVLATLTLLAEAVEGAQVVAPAEVEMTVESAAPAEVAQ